MRKITLITILYHTFTFLLMFATLFTYVATVVDAGLDPLPILLFGFWVAFGVGTVMNWFDDDFYVWRRAQIRKIEDALPHP